jgi:hypothetical protein
MFLYDFFPFIYCLNLHMLYVVWCARSLDEMTKRYLQRESRPEDLQRMQQMLQQIAEQEKAVRRAMEDMKYYKLELLNREENYNKTFGRTPKVSGGAGAVMGVGGASMMMGAGLGVSSAGVGGGMSMGSIPLTPTGAGLCCTSFMSLWRVCA